MKPITTTHELLEAAARLLEAHEFTNWASQVRQTMRVIPDEPLTLERHICYMQCDEHKVICPNCELTNAAPEADSGDGNRSLVENGQGNDSQSGTTCNLESKPPVAAPQSDTPISDRESYDAIKNTNSALLANDVQEVVPADVSRKFERENRELREATIEECAKVADNEWVHAASLSRSKCAGNIARAIRALKDKGKE